MSKIRRAVWFQLAGLVLAGIFVTWLAHHFDLLRLIERLQGQVGQMELWGAVCYPFLLAGCNLLLLPGGVIAVGSGLFFGLWWGALLVWLGNIIGAAAAFQISRRLGRQWVERKLMRDPKWLVLDEAIAREGRKIIFLSQVHPLFPTSLLNYIYGVTRIRFWPCMLWIALGQAPGLFFYTYLGTLAQLGIKLLRGKSHPLPMEYVIWIGGLFLTLGVTVALGRLALKLMHEVEQVAEARKNPAPATGTGQKPLESPGAGAALTHH
jgi:uncharacterized membrane protein YdjX (TVP38/TMEM64 family)